ncbi:PucR family transcriptional regulator [Actinomadura darangshiensis]|uniref:PucR family transcriptional regulator n=1 Tax=Actinomadura darangshiensis TaxID=705336 RepID=A0A4R5BJC1_9ACTN|nr:helix-turn-helix domain-containing protein [Actinomadura darangshiensis]TDD86838.1 PucR family transcriptional regulator [Actinomadura darangshiensis]
MRLSDLGLTEAQVTGLSDVLRRRLPDVAAEAVGEIQAQLPALVRPHDPRYATFLTQAVHEGIGRFVEVLTGGDGHLEELCDFYRDLGVLIAEEGIAQDTWQAGFRVSTGVAINRLTEAVGSLPGVTPTVVAKVAQDVLYYLEQITSATAEGYAGARSAADVLHHRRKLLELLISDDPRPGTVRRLAADAGWAVPRTIAAVALSLRADAAVLRPGVPADALTGLHMPEPCLIIPDPAGPGRRDRLAAELKDWTAAVGPTVPVTQAGRSLRWARRTLELAARGGLDTGRPVHAGDHGMPLVLLHGAEMMDQLTAGLLAPLAGLRRSREALMETLLRCLQTGFNASEVAAILHMHPQTIRYRMRQLDEAFGPAIREPDRNLEYQAAVTYWLQVHPLPELPGS